MGESPQIVAQLSLGRLGECGGIVHEAAGVHHVLPHQETIRIAQIVKPILGIETAAPDANHIEMTAPTVVNQPLGALTAPAGGHTILGYVVGAHNEGGQPIHGKGKFLPVGILFGRNHQGAQTQPFHGAVYLPTIHQQGDSDGVEGLIAQSVGIPQ